MASPDKVYREFVTRTHRMMAAYLAMVAWVRDLDCVAVARDEIVRFWGLSQRVEKQRLVWLREDVRQFFPYVRSLKALRGTGRFRSVFFARREFPAGVFIGDMSDQKRALEITKKGCNAAVVALPSETDMLTLLTPVIHGLGCMPVPEPVPAESAPS